jgi:nitrogen PTS system EIIA component
MGEEAASEIMTIAQVAEYLQLAEKTVLRMVQRGEIPAAKVASQWRFLRPVVRDWLLARMQTLTPHAPVGGDSLLPLQEIIRPELMTLDVQPGPKEAILRQLLAPLLRTGFAQDTNRLLATLVERERMMTTAIGHGIAIPHPRRPIAGMFPEPAIALGLCADGADFEAIDDQKVHVFFLMCATREEIHLKLMAKVAWLAREDLLSRLRIATTPQEAHSVIAEVARGFEDSPA